MNREFVTSVFPYGGAYLQFFWLLVFIGHGATVFFVTSTFSSSLTRSIIRRMPESWIPGWSCKPPVFMEWHQNQWSCKFLIRIKSNNPLKCPHLIWLAKKRMWKVTCRGLLTCQVCLYTALKKWWCNSFQWSSLETTMSTNSAWKSNFVFKILTVCFWSSWVHSSEHYSHHNTVWSLSPV